MKKMRKFDVFYTIMVTDCKKKDEEKKEFLIRINYIRFIKG